MSAQAARRHYTASMRAAHDSAGVKRPYHALNSVAVAATALLR